MFLQSGSPPKAIFFLKAQLFDNNCLFALVEIELSFNEQSVCFNLNFRLHK